MLLAAHHWLSSSVLPSPPNHKFSTSSLPSRKNPSLNLPCRTPTSQLCCRASLITSPDCFEVGRLIGSYGFMNVTSYSGFQPGVDFEYSQPGIGQLKVQDVDEGRVKIRLYEGRIAQGALKGTSVIFKVYPGQRAGGIEADMMAANELNTHAFLQSSSKGICKNLLILVGGFETKTGEQWLAFRNDGKYSAADYAKITSEKISKSRSTDENSWNRFEQEEIMRYRRSFVIKLLQGAIRGLAYLHDHDRLHQSLGPSSVVLNTLAEKDAAYLVPRLRDLAFSVDVRISYIEEGVGTLAEGLWKRANAAGAFTPMEKKAFGIADDIYEAGLLLAYLAFVPFCEAGVVDSLSLQRLLESTFRLDVEATRESSFIEKKMNNVKFRVERFDSKDFGFWRMQMEDYLYQKSLHEPLSGTKPEEMKQEEWDLKDRQALGVVRLTLSRNVVFNIEKVKTTTGLFMALANMYEKPSAMNKVSLMRRLFNLRMSENGSATNHINEFNMIISQLSSVEINFEDEIKALILLFSLPESWSIVVSAISSAKGSWKLNFDEIRDVILSESIRKRELGESSGSALSVDRRGRGSGRGPSRHGQLKSKTKEKSSNSVMCWNCGENGHFKSNCPKPRKQQSQESGENNESVNSAEDSGDALVLSVNCPVESWIIDSGAPFHSSPNKGLFLNFKPGNFGKVYLADSKALEIQGKGNVRIQTPAGNQWILEDVRYIPGLRKNLISVSQLENTCYIAKFGNGSWKIVKGARVVVRSMKSGTLYTTNDCRNLAAVTEGTSSSSYWHNRLGKQKRVNFSEVRSEPKKEKLDLAHADQGKAAVASKSRTQSQTQLAFKKVSRVKACQHGVFGKQSMLRFATGSERRQVRPSKKFAGVVDCSVLRHANHVAFAKSVAETANVMIKAIPVKKSRQRLDLVGDCKIV